MGGGSSSLFTSYYLLKDILEINRCLGLYSTQEYNETNYKILNC